jgi:hypothetical protein
VFCWLLRYLVASDIALIVFAWLQLENEDLEKKFLESNAETQHLRQHVSDVEKVHTDELAELRRQLREKDRYASVPIHVIREASDTQTSHLIAHWKRWSWIKSSTPIRMKRCVKRFECIAVETIR